MPNVEDIYSVVADKAAEFYNHQNFGPAAPALILVARFARTNVPEVVPGQTRRVTESHWGYLKLDEVTIYVMSSHVLSCHVMTCHVMSCHFNMS